MTHMHHFLRSLLEQSVLASRGALPIITELPVRGLLGNPYMRSCIALVRYICTLTRSTGAIRNVGQKGTVARVSKLILCETVPAPFRSYTKTKCP